jgi:hypothetical protein
MRTRLVQAGVEAIQPDAVQVAQHHGLEEEELPAAELQLGDPALRDAQGLRSRGLRQARILPCVSEQEADTADSIAWHLPGLALVRLRRR